MIVLLWSPWGASSSDIWKEEHCLVLVLFLLGVSDYSKSLLYVGNHSYRNPQNNIRPKNLLYYCKEWLEKITLINEQ